MQPPEQQVVGCLQGDLVCTLLLQGGCGCHLVLTVRHRAALAFGLGLGSPSFRLGCLLDSQAAFAGHESCHPLLNPSLYPLPPRCQELMAQVSMELSSLNIYNILEDCHTDSLAPASLRAQQAQRLADVRSSHKAWPVIGSVQQGQRVHNWATLLGHNPPCTVST